MADISLEQVWHMIEQLDPTQLDILLDRLAAIRADSYEPVTLASIFAERDRRLASGESKRGLPSLRNAYADPPLNVDEATLRADLKAFSREWESELDDAT